MQTAKNIFFVAFIHTKHPKHDFIKDTMLRLDLIAEVWYNKLKMGGDGIET